MLKNDGDIIRGLGFVALYASYSEEMIDNLLSKLDPIERYNDKKTKWQITKKIRRAKKIIKKTNSQELGKLIDILHTCSKLFESRNEFIHGRIYANYDRPDVLRSGKVNVADREVAAEELYKLANAFSAVTGEISGFMPFKLPRAINEFVADKKGESSE